MPIQTTTTLPTLQEVDAYPVPELLVPRIMKLYGHDRGYAEGIVKEAKRMLYLYHCTKEPVTPSVEIDDAWHEMLMFTKFYQQFCSFLGGFVHHNPTPPADPDAPPPPPSSEPTTYDKTLLNYERVFGQKPDSQYWTE